MKRSPHETSPAGHGISRFARSLRAARGHVSEQKKTFAAILTVAIVIFGLSIWPFASAHLQAIAVLREVSNQPVPWYTHHFTVPVSTRDFTFAIESPAGEQTVRARLYTPQDQPNAPALVLFHGVHHMGIDEPRMVGFAAAMASCGLRVLTPELPDIKDYHISKDSVRTIGESVRWFANQTGGPVGVMGLSFSGGLALVAAADPLYHPEFKFILAVGAQDSMERVTQYYRTGADVRPDGTTEVLPAHEYGPLVIEYEYLEDFLPSQDLGPVRAVLRAHLYEDKEAEAQALSKVTDAQKRQALELMDPSSPETRARIAAVIARHTAEMEGLSPRGRLKRLRTPVYLLHGEADNVIPSAETLWMASELPREDLKEMLISPILSHVDMDDTKPSLMDQWRLVHFFALVMRAAHNPHA